MRLKLDENLPEAARLAVASLGHHADTISNEGLIGAGDLEVLAQRRMSSALSARSIKALATFVDTRLAATLWERSRRLAGPELIAPGGSIYRSGDRVITLAPGPRGAWVTSQSATVTAVDPESRTMTAITPDGRQLHMGADDIGADRLGYGYAITGHRAQGTTVEVAHVLDDGGGRELAYVAMSRARVSSHVYTTASDLAQAGQRLVWSWDDERRQQWASDQARAAQRLEALRAKHRELVRTIPPPSPTSSPKCASSKPISKRTSPISGPAPDGGQTRPSGLVTRISALPGEPTRRTSGVPKIPTAGSSLAAAAVETSTPVPPRCRQPRVPGSRRPNLPLGFSKVSGPGSLPGLASLEDARVARAEFIRAHSELVDRINQLLRAIETQQASPRRHRTYARSAPTPPSITRQSIGPSYDLSPTPAIPTGPDL